LRAWYRLQEHEDALALGKSIFEKELRKNDLKITNQNIQILARTLKFSDSLAMFVALGHGDLLIEKVIETLMPVHKQPESTNLPAQDKDFSLESSKAFIEIQGLENLMVHFAHCCNPLPGDELIGYITRGRGLSVHRKDCSNPAFQQLAKREPHRILNIHWQKPTADNIKSIIRMQIVATPRPRLNYDITSLLAQQNIKTLTSSSELLRDHERITIVIEITDRKQIKNLTGALLRINGILEVYQI
jgi:GTP pyrophosphokinase